MQRATLIGPPKVGLKSAKAQEVLDQLRGHAQFRGIKEGIIHLTRSLWKHEAVRVDVLSAKPAHVLDNPLPYRELWIEAFSGSEGVPGSGIRLCEMPGELILYALWLVKSYTNNSHHVILLKFNKHLRPRQV